jgi:hypothetical protein
VEYEPSWRKPVGILGMLLIVALWVVLVACAAGWIGTLPLWAQTIIYLFAGVVWIAPMRPLMIWIETGRWRA